MVQTILSIAGKPGLYKLVSRAKMNLIVETIDEKKKRIPTFATDRVTSLSDISMFTEGDDVPLYEVLVKVREKEDGKATSLDWRKASPKDLQDYFAEILPDFDRDRVHNSDIKKLLQWYDILIKAGISNFEEVLKPAGEEEVDESQESNEGRKVTAKPGQGAFYYISNSYKRGFLSKGVTAFFGIMSRKIFN